MRKRTKLLAAILSASMMVIPVSAQEYSYRGSAASTTDAREFNLEQLDQSDGIMTLSGIPMTQQSISMKMNTVFCTTRTSCVCKMVYSRYQQLQNYKKLLRLEVLNC
jgi:hypothetical protein